MKDQFRCFSKISINPSHRRASHLPLQQITSPVEILTLLAVLARSGIRTTLGRIHRNVQINKLTAFNALGARRLNPRRRLTSTVQAMPSRYLIKQIYKDSPSVDYICDTEPPYPRQTHCVPRLQVTIVLEEQVEVGVVDFDSIIFASLSGLSHYEVTTLYLYTM